MARCLLGFGANLGDPPGQIAAALRQLTARGDVRLCAVSSTWTTRPVGGPPDQPPYRNAAALIETRLSPDELWGRTQAVESALGRERSQVWGPRLIDIDLLLYEDAIVRQPGLRIPHPLMVARRFALGPAAEIAPQLQHPILGWTLERLWEHLTTVPPRFVLVGCQDNAARAAIATAAGAVPIVDPARASPATGGRSPVPDYRWQLELLERRVAALRQSGWAAPHLDRWLLCEYWLDESWLQAQATLSGEDWRRFAEEFARQTQDIAPPKLVILVVGSKQESDRPVLAAAASNVTGLRQRLIAQGTTPFVEVEATTPDDVVRVAAGAMLAMQ
jgi:2-amino-4-hydroxy-6-hydroxymethyldihydropteridine diphosphokinase